MKVNTKLLKTMLGKVGSCKPTNILEITNYYELEFSDKGFIIRATDGTNYMTVIDEDYTQDEVFSVIVKADQFTKLINKTTKEEVTLTVKSDYLEVKGNGTYKVEIVADEEYPTHSLDIEEFGELQLAPFKNAMQGAKNAKSQTANDGVLFSYLVRDECLYTADAIKVYSKDLEGIDMEDVEILIPPGLATLLMSLDGDTVKVYIDKDDNKAQFVSKSVTVVGGLSEGADQYPDLAELFDEPFPHQARLSKQNLISAIDRLNLFVSLFDKGVISIVFTQDGLLLSTASNSNEMVMYETPLAEPVEYVYSVNSKYLQDLVSVADNDMLTVCFGLDDTLKLMTADSMMILATAENDE